MIQQEFNTIQWKVGQTLELTNGKSYKIIYIYKHKLCKKLILYSREYDSVFVVTYRFVKSLSSGKVVPLTSHEKKKLLYFFLTPTKH